MPSTAYVNDVDEILKQLFTVYGPLGLGWAVAGVIWFKYQKIVQDYHDAVVDNARVTERLAMLIEERTRHRNGR